MSGGIDCELVLPEKNVGTDSFCPYGTSRLLPQFQALRTWLLSFRPYGTSHVLPGMPQEGDPSRRDRYDSSQV
jgi:hypothetical protein